jgi:hypothetical protein
MSGHKNGVGRKRSDAVGRYIRIAEAGDKNFAVLRYFKTTQQGRTEPYMHLKGVAASAYKLSTDRVKYLPMGLHNSAEPFSSRISTHVAHGNGYVLIAGFYAFQSCGLTGVLLPKLAGFGRKISAGTDVHANASKLKI